ncbi:MAG: CPBP family intramembrane glutamic endopeptidase [Candidatus Binatia bacterium]
MSASVRLTVVALGVQAALAALGWLGASMAQVPVRFGARPLVSVAVGVGVAAMLAAVNLWTLTAPVAAFRPLRAAVEDLLVPTFGRFAPGQILLVSLAAGVGEELCFRGWLQPVFGAVAAALAFGAAHVAGVRTLALGAWATAMGLVLGGLVGPTGGLGASMTAHACYDMLAFQYLRRLAGAAAGGRAGW